MKSRKDGFTIKAKYKPTGIIEITVRSGGYQLFILSILDSVYQKAKNNYQKYKLIEHLFAFVVVQIDALTVRLIEYAVREIDVAIGEQVEAKDEKGAIGE